MSFARDEPAQIKAPPEGKKTINQCFLKLCKSLQASVYSILQLFRPPHAILTRCFNRERTRFPVRRRFDPAGKALAVQQRQHIVPVFPLFLGSIDFPGARLHEELVTIHPFSDGNGRIARLAMNTVLIQNGFLPVQIHPVIRQPYIDSLREAQTSGNDGECIELILQQEIESQKEILRIFETQ